MPEANSEHLRKIYKQHWQECQRIDQLRWQIQKSTREPTVTPDGNSVFLSTLLPDYPAFPEQCRGMTCGAKTRAGTACKLTSLYSNGRCKFHGGMSTGPKTAAGKARSARNGNLRSKAHKRLIQANH